MAYFNGSMSGPGLVRQVHKPMTRLYCDNCAEASIPLPPVNELRGVYKGQQHYDTEFRWAPRYGAPCMNCGKDC